MKPKRIIFLDVDGVLNNLGSVIALGSPSKALDPVSVGLLRKLCEETDARIVVSSTWRQCYQPISTLKEALLRGCECVPVDRIIGVTPILHGKRGTEIAKWISEKGYTGRYVIIDDDSDMLPSQQPHFVHTTFNDGFRVKHYYQALKILDPAKYALAHYGGGVNGKGGGIR